MNDNKYLAGMILKQLVAGSPVVMASIVSMEGSTPRETGTKMVVGVDGKGYGTVGGGLLEATTISESVAVITTGRSKFIDFDLSGEDTASEDMICGGKTVLLLDYLSIGDKNISLFENMIDSISKGENFYFVTVYTETGEVINISGHVLLFSDGRTAGDKVLEDSDIMNLRAELHNISSTTILTADERKFIIDPIRRVQTLHCFGAGHVAVPTAHIASMIGFKVIVYDDREEFANAERFPDAEEISIVKDYDHAMDGLDIDNDSFIIILTRGHRYDREVLEQAIRTDAGYIGMISSKKKRDSVYKALISAGITTAEELERVHSPIGLAIRGETPEEIAVSIVAELIFERGKKADEIR
ncbi:MAG: XdhC family protein [Dehalococcoidales bacterium]|nr:XdhC family protein [Dehalococcoidales bacterium]